jgi:hypothetical protein
VLKSKKALGWRTLLIVPELECELDTLSRADMRGKLEIFRKLRETHAALEEALNGIFAGRASEARDDMAACFSKGKKLQRHLMAGYRAWVSACPMARSLCE